MAAGVAMRGAPARPEVELSAPKGDAFGILLRATGRGTGTGKNWRGVSDREIARYEREVELPDGNGGIKTVPGIIPRLAARFARKASGDPKNWDALLTYDDLVQEARLKVFVLLATGQARNDGYVMEAVANHLQSYERRVKRGRYVEDFPLGDEEGYAG